MPNTLFEGSAGVWIKKMILIAVALLAVLLAVESLSRFMELRYIGAGLPATNTISVTGHGEKLAIPDIALFTASIVVVKPTLADAQAEATSKANAMTAYLKEQGVDEKDIQTSDYSVAPRYEWMTYNCVGNCAPGKQVLVGYEVRQTTTIKVRDTEKAGTLLAGVGSKGATEVSGLTLTFDDPALPAEEARAKAIEDAKEKAEKLADELGVRLVRVVSFNESGNYPQPMLYGRGGVATMDAKATAPEISVGQNKVQSDVTVTYEIR